MEENDALAREAGEVKWAGAGTTTSGMVVQTGRRVSCQVA